MQMKSFELGVLQVNCYIIWDIQSKLAAIIDPGDDSQLVHQYVQTNQLQVQYILLTHAHFDHISGVKAMKQKYASAQILVSKQDLNTWNQQPLFAKQFGIDIMQKFQSSPDDFIEDKQVIPLGHLNIEVITTPGHTPGSVCFKINNAIISGDTVFSNSIGRTDFEGGDIRQMKQSVRKLEKIIADSDIIYPGHGESAKGRKAIQNAVRMTQ
ncbi:Hydroxyacylglutathione_hydrolase [Hexamita inflata]|uniref:Hydroxyacylglutathione_hydrolase n=1 Tax=Hexamita inflata TaxID=28002 RepID=A0ABP1GHQ4_9EUKA